MILSINIRSLKNKETFVESLANIHSADIIVLTESWFPEKYYAILDEFIFITSLTRKDTIGGHHGGVAIYTRKTSNVKFDFVNDVSTSDDCQIVQFIMADINFYGIYRSPSQSNEDFNKFAEFLDRTCSSGRKVIFGDLNLPKINWTDTTAEGLTNQRILSITLAHNLENYVSGSTHARGNILDLVLATPNTVNDVINDEVPNRYTDHNAIIFTSVVDKDTRAFKTITMHNKIDKDNFLRDLFDVNWLSLPYYTNLVEASNYLTEKLRTSYVKHTPTKTVINDTSKNNYLPSTVKQIELVKFLKATKQTKKCNAAMSKLESMITREQERKDERYLKYLSSHSKNIYQTFSKKNFQKQVTCIQRPDGTLATEDWEIAQLCNDFYSEVMIDSDPINIDWSNLEGAIITDIEVTEELVLGAIQSCKDSCGPDPEGITNRMLKLGAPAIILPLTIILREMFKSGIIPPTWKEASIKVLAKKGNCAILSNTRPISICSTQLKCGERLARRQIYDKLEETNFFPELQYGFREKLGTEMCLMDLQAQLFADLADNYFIYMVHIDFSRCFDRVEHNALLQACYDAGIRGNCGVWLQNFLTGRTQHVDFGCHQAPHVPVRSSCVQGSVMGTLLFLILASKLKDKLDFSSAVCYCDDTKLYFRFSNRHQICKFQSDLHRYYEFTKSIKQELNFQKSGIIMFGNPPIQQLYMGGKMVQHLKEAIDLGVCFTSGSPEIFATHRKRLLGKVTAAFRAARAMVKNSSFDVKRRVYNTYLSSIFCYGCALWVNAQICESLDDLYREFFSKCVPSQNKNNSPFFIPLSPSELVLASCLTNLESLRKRGKLDNIIIKQSNFPTRFSQQNKIAIRKYPSRNILKEFSIFSPQIIALFNDAIERNSVSTFRAAKSFIINCAQLPTPGPHFRQLLSTGRLIGKNRRGLKTF